MSVTQPPSGSGTRESAAVLRSGRRAVWIGVAVLGLAAAAVAAFTVGRTAGPVSPSAAPAPTPGGQRAAGAGLSPWAIPVSVPDDVGWTGVQLPRQATWIPVSPVHGPARAGAGQWGGWAQTPTGAVMAAATITVGWGLDNAAASQYLAAHSVTSPDYLDQMLAQRPADGLAPQVTTVPTGFRVDDYTVTGATVTLRATSWLPGSAATLSMTRMALLWVDGDWKVLTTPGEHPRLSSTVTGAFVAWGPQ